jgi:hypothetical protein
MAGNLTGQLIIVTFSPLAGLDKRRVLMNYMTRQACDGRSALKMILDKPMISRKIDTKNGRHPVVGAAKFPAARPGPMRHRPQIMPLR